MNLGVFLPRSCSLFVSQENAWMQVHDVLPGVAHCYTHCTIVAIGASGVLCKVMACASQITEVGRGVGVALEILPLANVELFLPMMIRVRQHPSLRCIVAVHLVTSSHAQSSTG